MEDSNLNQIRFLDSVLEFVLIASVILASIGMGVAASSLLSPFITNQTPQYATISTTILSKEVLPSDGFSINHIYTTDGEFDVNDVYVTNEMFISLPIGEPIRIYVRNGIVVGYSINKTRKL
jgi:hypothetical protein